MLLHVFSCAHFHICSVVTVLPDAEAAEELVVVLAVELHLFVLMVATGHEGAFGGDS